MCGIVGLFLKDRKLERELGGLLSDMLVTMSDRGPDSAGIAIYGKPTRGQVKVTVQSPLPDQDLPPLAGDLDKAGLKASVEIRNTHAVISTVADLTAVRAFLASRYPQLRIMSAGDSIEIFKEVGLPKSVVDRFDIRKACGTHGIGHTRPADLGFFGAPEQWAPEGRELAKWNDPTEIRYLNRGPQKADEKIMNLFD